MVLFPIIQVFIVSDFRQYMVNITCVRCHKYYATTAIDDVVWCNGCDEYVCYYTCSNYCTECEEQLCTKCMDKSMDESKKDMKHKETSDGIVCVECQ